MLQFYVILPTHCVALAGRLPVQRFPPACTRFFRCGCFSRFKAIRAGRRRPRHSGIFNTFLLFLLPLPAAGGADAAAGRGYFRRGYWFHGKEPSEAEEIRQVNFLKAEPCFSMFFLQLFNIRKTRATKKCRFLMSFFNMPAPTPGLRKI